MTENLNDNQEKLTSMAVWDAATAGSSDALL
jgi:hypothetical protein